MAAKTHTVALTSLPEGITWITNYAFRGCSNLAKLTFKGIPEISSTVFSDCTNLTVINVPWSEGAVTYTLWEKQMRSSII